MGVRYANGLDVPDFVFEDPAIQRIMGLQPEHFLLLVSSPIVRMVLTRLQFKWYLLLRQGIKSPSFPWQPTAIYICWPYFPVRTSPQYYPHPPHSRHDPTRSFWSRRRSNCSSIQRVGWYGGAGAFVGGSRRCPGPKVYRGYEAHDRCPSGMEVSHRGHQKYFGLLKLQQLSNWALFRGQSWNREEDKKGGCYANVLAKLRGLHLFTAYEMSPLWCDGRRIVQFRISFLDVDKNLWVLWLNLISCTLCSRR